MEIALCTTGRSALAIEAIVLVGEAKEIGERDYPERKTLFVGYGF